MSTDVTPARVLDARRLAPWIVIVGIALAPASALFALAWQMEDTPEELRITPEPVLVAPTRRIDDGRLNVVAELEIGDAPTLASPGWAGLVTSVEVSTGDVLTTGVAVLSVDRVVRLAVASDMPFHRDLSRGAKGEDVVALERVLAGLGLFTGEPDELFSSSTATAVKGLESAAGVERPTGVFSPSLVIWIPNEPLVVSGVLVNAGSPAPGLGTAIVSTEPEVLSVRFVRGEGSPLMFDGQRMVKVEGREVGVVTGATVPPEVARAIWEFGRSVALSSPNAGVTSIPVTLTYPEPLEVWSVPSSAVMVDTSGAITCVWVEEGGAFEPIPVTTVGGTLGVTDLGQSFADHVVLVNPLEVISDPSCP